MSLQTDDRKYQSGFANHFETEALAGALPIGRNSPQKCAYGLYAEQFSGSAFTAPREHNKRSWLYRIRPSVIASDFVPLDHPNLSLLAADVVTSPNQMRWNPPIMPDAPTDFIDGLITLCGGGDAMTGGGLAVHVYAANASMTTRFFYSADGRKRKNMRRCANLLLIEQQAAKATTVYV